MANWWESVKSVVGGVYCTVSDFAVWYTAQVSEILDDTKLDSVGEFQREYAAYANRLFCGDSPSAPLPPAFSPPFTGGQCEGRNYYVDIGYTVIYDDEHQDTYPPDRFTGAGKIGAPFWTPAPDPSANAIVQVPYASGAATFNRFVPPRFAGGGFVPVRSIGISVTVSPVTGTDDCGDLPAQATPTNEPFVVIRDVDYEDENGDPQTAEDVTFTYGLPVVEPDGTISVPYEVCYEDFCFRGKTNFGDEIRVIPRPPTADALPPTEILDEPIGEGSDEPEPELDGDPLDEAEKEKEPILGVFVRSQKDGDKSRATEILADWDAPAILAPNIGYVCFRVLVGDESGWLPDIPIKNVNAYVPVPDKLEAVEAAVFWQSGWEGKYLVHRGKHCCEECADND